MDEQERELERSASAGDENARRALGHARRRRGLGWHGETMPRRITLADDFPTYSFDTGRGFSIEMIRLHEAGVWIARRPTRWLDYERWRHEIDGSSRTHRGRTRFGSTDDDPVADREWEKAATFCHWIGCRLPLRVEIERARMSLPPHGFIVPQGLREWCDDGELGQSGAFIVPPRGTAVAEPTHRRRADLGFRATFAANSDIEFVVDRLGARLPGIGCSRHRPEGTVGGVWLFWRGEHRVHVRSSDANGMCPFSLQASNHEAPFEGDTVDEVVERIVEWLG